MLKKLLTISILLCTIGIKVGAETCTHNPIANGFKFDEPIIKIYLDKKFSDPNTEDTLFFSHRGRIDVAVDQLNEHLINTQLELIETDEDFTLQGLGVQCNFNITCIDNLRRLMRVNYKNGIVLSVGSNVGGAGSYCSDGSNNEECEQTIKFGYVTLGKNNSNNYDNSTQEDIARHEIMHGLGLPHVYGPYQIQGAFDSTATATPSKGSSWKKFQVPNMDPIINTNSHGLKETDIQNLQDKYGKDPERLKLIVNLIQENGEVVRAMNVALLAKKRIVNSTARSSYDGISVLSAKKGKYYILVRPMANALLGNSSSGVEGERKPTFEPANNESRYVCKRDKKTGIYKLCSNNKKKRAIKLKKDKSITISIE